MYEKVWQAQEGSQSLFLQCPLREVCYSGTRGPGKTDALLMSFAQHCGKGYGLHWRGVIFRKEYKHLDDIITKSKRWFNQIRAEDRPRFLSGQGQMKWVWPGGEELLFRAFATPDDYWSYHGHEYCVEVGTPVLTPNGYVPIESLKVGDKVITPGGVDEVTMTFTPKVKDCVTASFYDADQRLVAQQVQSVTHRLLTIDQAPDKPSSLLSRSGMQSSGQNLAWRSYKYLLDEHQGILEEGASRKDGRSLGKGAFSRRQGALRTQQPLGIAAEPVEPYRPSNEFGQPQSIQYRDVRISIEQAQGLLEGRKPLPWDCLPPPESFELTEDHHACGEMQDAQSLSDEAQDFQFDYRLSPRFCDEQPLPSQDTDLDGAPLQVGAGIRARAGLLLGAAGQFRTHSRCDAESFFENPYDQGSSVPAGDIGFVDVELVPCGKRLTVDISVGKNKLYITMGGVVNSNCFIGWEELTSWASMDCYESMMSCNRSSYHAKPGQPDIPLMVRSTTNPYGVGHNWVKAYFIDPAPYGIPIFNSEGQARVTLFGSVRENKFIDDEYLKTLNAISDPNKRKAWLFGSWDITSGGMFDDLWVRDKHVLPLFDIPSSWRIDRAFDWGSSRPFSVGWWAESDGIPAKVAGQDRHFPRGTLIRINEWYGCTGKPNEGLRMTAVNVASGILERERSMKVKALPGPADSAIYAVTDDVSIGQNMEKAGVRWTMADKKAGSRKNGWELMRGRLEVAASGEDKPGLFVMENCRDFIRTVPSLPRDNRDPDDIDCFVAGTIISCPKGDSPVESMIVGDIVDTPIGPRRVIKAGMSGVARTVRLTMSNGAVLEGTKDHKIYVEGIGLLPMCKVSLGQSIATKETTSWLKQGLTKALFSAGMKGADILNAAHAMLASTEQAYSIESCGSAQTGQYQKDCISTTKTMTQEITSLKIFNWSIREIMRDTTSKSGLQTVEISESDWRSGAIAAKDKRYLEKILKSAVKILPSENLRALIVANLLIPSIQGKNSALSSVRQLQNEQGKNKKNALYAVLKYLLSRMQQKKQRPVVIRVDGNCGVKEVFNLTVEQSHLFYANGFLATNTEAEDHIADEVRYRCLAATRPAMSISMRSASN